MFPWTLYSGYAYDERGITVSLSLRQVVNSYHRKDYFYIVLKLFDIFYSEAQAV